MVRRARFVSTASGKRGALATDEIKSPIRPVDYMPPERVYREVSPGHVVQLWEEAAAPRAAA